MRLRYLHLSDLPPLHDVKITFGHEAILGHNLAVHFVAGVNGTGKTRLLQAIAETFLSLACQTLPPFGITLAYDLEKDGNSRTILFHRPEDTLSQTYLVEFTKCIDTTETTSWADLASVDWTAVPEALSSYRIQGELLRGDDLRFSERSQTLLPHTMLVYTSGAATLWEGLFDQQVDGERFADIQLEIEEESAFIEERPPRWDLWQEREYQQREGGPLPKIPSVTDGYASAQDFIFMTSTQLKLAACAITLQQAIAERASSTNLSTTNKTLRELLNEVKWDTPLVLTLHIKFDPDRLPFGLSAQLHDLYQIATSIICEPGSRQGRTLVFELHRLLAEELPVHTIKDWTSRPTIQAFCEILAGENPTAFEIFRTLYEWQENGLLENITITLRGKGVDHALLLYDWLSDGERMFLGRIALFYLLQGRENALLILDEPEPHFNDYWKRRIVDIIDDSLHDQHTEVLISTHSSIALTDVFHTEITLLDDGQAYRPRIRTFGASPSEIMRDVFGTPDSVGQRAAEFLDLLLLMFAYPQEVEAIWMLGEDQEIIAASPAFQRLSEHVQREAERWAIRYESQEQLEQRLLQKLLDVYSYAQPQTGEPLNVTTVLQILQDQLVGPGYYQFEIIRRILGLKEATDAPSD